MNKRIQPKPPAPTDEEILAYDNVPVDVAARYLDWPENTVRLALREGRASFGTAVRNNGITHKISPGGLVRYKREGAPCINYETMKLLLENVIRTELDQITRDVIRGALHAEYAQIIETIGETVGTVIQRTINLPEDSDAATADEF